MTSASCPLVTNEETLSNGAGASKSQVSFAVNQDLPDCAQPVPEKAYTVFNSNENCGKAIVNGEMVIPGKRDPPLCHPLPT
jgi:hypothetical protein